MGRKKLIQIRRDTAADWLAANPTLEAGEPGYETDTDKLKIGDGVLSWNLLPYFTAEGTPPDLSGYATTANLSAHTSNKSNPHEVTKAQVGLGNVPNTDFTAAVAANTAKVSFNSTAQAKLNGIESGAQVNTVTSVAGKTGAISLDKNDVGLGNVSNTSDANKPVSNATQTALNAKQNTLVSGTNIKTVNGESVLGSGDLEVVADAAPWGEITGDIDDQTDLQAALAAKAEDANLVSHVNDLTNPHEVTKDQVNLGNVDNTSDLAKPISTATQIALNGKVSSVVAGTNITVDNTDPKNPIVSTAGVGAIASVNGQTGAVVLDQDDIADGTTYKQYSATDKTKLAGIETGADVTDATNVAAAGAVMEADTTTASMSFVVDEDDMASDSATKIPSQQSTKAYVDKSVQVPGIEAGTPYKSKLLKNWYDKLANSNTTGIDIVIMGDSISASASTNSSTARPWGWLLSDLFARKDYDSRYPDTPGVVQIAPDGYSPALANWGKTMTYCEGTATATGFGRYSSTMTNGQVAYQTVEMDAVSVLYNQLPTGGQIEVRDGAGGTLLTTIDTAGTAKGARMWTSSALTYGSHTIHLTAVCDAGETVVLNGVYAYSGNLTSGIRVWVAGRNGISSSTANSDKTFYQDFVELIDPDLTILATGANDTVSNYTTDMQANITQTQARTTGTVVLWGCYPITRLAKYLDAQSVLARDLARNNNIQLIDAFLAMPDLRQQSYFRDTLHPNDMGARIIAWHAYSVLNGDPMGFMVRELADRAKSGDLTSGLALKANIANPAFTGSGSITNGFSVAGALTSASGRHGSDQFFGSPYYYQKLTSTDTQSTITLAGAGFNNFAYTVNAPGLWLGVGGSTVPDTNLYRSAADTLKTDDNLIVAAAGTAANSVVNIDATQTLTNKTLTSPVINTAISGTAFLDEDDMASNSATKVASQQSTKAYVDTRNHAVVAKESALYYSMSGLTTASTLLLMTASGVLVAHPVWLQAGSYDRIAVTTTVAAVSTWRLGVYPTNPATGLPDGQTLTLDCGTIDMNATAGFLTATISLTIPTSGVYWLAALVDSYTATPTVHGWTTTSGTAQMPLLGAPVGGTAAAAGRHQISRTATGVATGSMPATFPSASWAANAPQIKLRAA